MVIRNFSITITSNFQLEDSLSKHLNMLNAYRTVNLISFTFSNLRDLIHHPWAVAAGILVFAIEYARTPETYWCVQAITLDGETLAEVEGVCFSSKIETLLTGKEVASYPYIGG